MMGMVEVKGVADAEDRARSFIMERHSGVRRILFKKVDRMVGSWLVDGVVWYSLLGIFTIKKFFRLMMNLENGKVASYQETLFQSKR
jgi:hypothetical protein